MVTGDKATTLVVCPLLQVYVVAPLTVWLDEAPGQIDELPATVSVGEGNTVMFCRSELVAQLLPPLIDTE